MTSLFLVVNGYALPTVGDKVTFESTISGFSGGPFDATVIDDSGKQTNYITFCLEKNEYISTNNTVFEVSSVEYFATKGGRGFNDNSPDLSDSGLSTSGKDYISDATKWVYWNYLYGNLVTAYDSYLGKESGITDMQLGKAVQRTIWQLEDETDSYSSKFYDMVINQATNGYSISGDVQVMNLTWNSGQEAQSQLIAAPVPEPSTMLLFGTGIAGLASIARRRRK